MKRTTIALAASIGAGVLALIVAVFLAFGANAQVSDFRRGAEEGYELRGTYYAGEDRIVFLSFYEEDGQKQWVHSDAQGGITEGLYEKTGDPNLYTLLDADGNEAGWAHLAYANAQAEGLLFYSLGSEEASTMQKDSASPRIVETPAE